MRPIVVRSVLVPAAAIVLRAVRAQGPGGQNVNKVASKVELRVDLEQIEGLEAQALARLRALANLDAEGRVLVTSQATRDQARNIEDARRKIEALLERALERPKPRRATKPSRSSKERRLRDKQHRAKTKASRRGDD